VQFKSHDEPKKRLGYANPNLINQIQLNPQINENNQKYKNMKVKSKITAKKDSPLRIGLLYHPT
jgi:ribosomal protein L11